MIHGQADKLQAYVREVKRDRPVLFIPGWDQTSQAVDQSGNGNNGTYSGGYTLGQAGPFPGTRSGKFDGSSGYINISDSSALAAYGSVSCEAWVYLTGTPNNYSQVIDKEGSTNGYSFIVHSDLTVQFYVANASSFSGVISNKGLILKQWYHICAVSNGSDLKAYINGVLSSSPFSAASPGSTTGVPLYIGANTLGFSRYFTGYVSMTAVYRSILSPSRIASHYNTAMGKGISRRYFPAPSSAKPWLYAPSTSYVA